MSFQPNIRFWNGLLIGAMLVLFGLFVFDLVVPVPKATQRVQARKEDDFLLQKETKNLRDDYAVARAGIDARVWNATPDAIGSQTLEMATNSAKRFGLALSGFRPQKPTEEGELTRLTYVMTLEGPYPGLQAMVQDLETPGRRLSVHMVQVASADDASDLVNATIGVSAFIEKKKPKTEEKPQANAKT